VKQLSIFINIEEPYGYYYDKSKKPVRIISLKDSMGWQEFGISVNGVLKSITLRVDAIYSGTKYSDLCISDIAIRVATGGQFNEDLAKRNRIKNEKFIAERLIKAQNMAKLPANGLVKPSYAPIAQSLVEKMPNPEKLPEIMVAKYHPVKTESLLLQFRFEAEDQKAAVTDEGIRKSFYDAVGQLNKYPKTIPFIPWLAELHINQLTIERYPVLESLVNEKQNIYELPCGYEAGSILKHEFSLFKPTTKNTVITNWSGPNIDLNPRYHIRFYLSVENEQWIGYATQYYIAPCCCGGGPRWIYTFKIYDQSGYLRWIYHGDPVYGRKNLFFIWNINIPQLEKIIDLYDQYNEEGVGEFPGRMEVFE
jgi:hypothetical protein